MTTSASSTSSPSQGASAKILIDNGPEGFKDSPELEVGIVLGLTAFVAITFLAFKMYFSPKSFVWRGNPGGVRSKSEEVVQSGTSNTPLPLLLNPFQISMEASQRPETPQIITKVQRGVDSLPPLQPEIQAGIQATEAHPVHETQHTENHLPETYTPPNRNHPEPENIHSRRQAQMPEDIETISLRSCTTQESSLLPPEYQSAWGGNAN